MTAAGGSWRVSPFDSDLHNRATFACGAPELDVYIRSYASQDVKRDVTRVFVATAGGTDVVAGYYSLSAASFRKDSLPATQAKRLPHYPVPAVLLGRLAVDNGLKGRGLGAHLLMDAFNRIYLASQAVAVQAVLVDARDAAAAAFYRRYGFVGFADDDRRMFLPMATVRQLVEGR
jgi:predicted GNAT family N-acyltransferase